MRLFFALWPDGAAASALEELAVALAPALGGKAVPREKIHLTLAFLGEVPPAEVERAIAAGDSVRTRELNVLLDRIGSFRRAKVAWAGSEAAPAGLAALHVALREALAERGFTIEDRDFAPHVTLVRGIVRALARKDMPRGIEWRADGFSLVRSEPGTGRYSIVASWDLAPA